MFSTVLRDQKNAKKDGAQKASASDDEAGYSTDEYENAGAYEYADEENAQTEDVDRETPSSQGSVDPYAYVVNDETEEAFEEDDLYRYDE